MERIKFESSDILDRLYAPTLTGQEALSFEDFLKLPVNEEYLKNQNEKLKHSVNEKLDQLISDSNNIINNVPKGAWLKVSEK